MVSKIRVGLILPANNVVTEPEFYSLGIDDVTFHSARIPVTGGTEADLFKMLGAVRKTARMLSTCKPDVIAYSCLSSSFIKGVGWDAKLGDAIEKASGVRAVTAATAMIQGLRDLRIRRVATLSAYGPRINSIMTRFLADNGFEVIKTLGLALSVGEVGEQPPERTLEQAKRIFVKDADGLFIGSTDLRSISVVELLERFIGKPVVSVNGALLKYSLESAGLKVKIKGYGRLLNR